MISICSTILEPWQTVCVSVCVCMHARAHIVCLHVCMHMYSQKSSLYRHAFPLLVTNCWCSDGHLFTVGLQKNQTHEISHSSIHQVQVLDSPTKVLFFSVDVPGITSASNHFCRSAPKCESLRN